MAWDIIFLGGSFLIHLLFPVGVILLWRGRYGRPQFSEPLCAKCGYDLRGMDFKTDGRRCSECGADLTARKAVHFGRHRKRPVLIGVGAVMMLPLVLMLGAGGVVTVWQLTSPGSGSPVRAARNSNNTQLISLLATTMDQPWTWQEIERRYDQGNFSPTEVDAAIDELIQHLQTNPNTRGQPPSWCRSFIEKAHRNGDLSNTKYGELCEVFYGPAPEVQVRPLVRAGEWIRFNVRYDRPWDLPNVKVVKALREVRYDGERIEVFGEHTGAQHHPDHLSHRGPFPIDGQLQLDLPPGRHELVFVVDAGVVDANATLAGQRGTPGQAKQWVNPLHTWTYEVPVTMDVVAAGEPIVEVIEAVPGGLSSNHLRVEQALVRGETRGVSVHVSIVSQTPATLPLSYRVQGKTADGTTMNFGGFVRRVRQSHDAYRTTLQVQLPDGLADGVNEIDLHFEPDPQGAGRTRDVLEIWGQPHVIRKVPLERYDLR